MIVKLNYGQSDFIKALELYKTIGAVGIIEQGYSYKPEKAAKHFLASKIGISKTEAKNYILPKRDFANPDLSTNCYYTIADVATYYRVIDFVCQALVQHACGQNNDIQQTKDYYFGAVITELNN